MPPSRRPFLRLLVAAAAVQAAGCVNFHAVEEGRVYRAAQPSAERLERWIWRHELRTIVFLRGGGPGDLEYETSRRPADAAGIDFVQIRLSAVRHPPKERLLALCEVLADESSYPLLLHCQGGADRTGLASAVYVLESTGDLDAAREQLGLAYGHVGIGRTRRMDEVLDMYEPYAGEMTFCEWVEKEYRQPAVSRSGDGRVSAGEPAARR